MEQKNDEAEKGYVEREIEQHIPHDEEQNQQRSALDPCHHCTTNNGAIMTLLETTEKGLIPRPCYHRYRPQPPHPPRVLHPHPPPRQAFSRTREPSAQPFAHPCRSQ